MYMELCVFLPFCMRFVCIPMRCMRNCMRICAYLCVNIRFDCIYMRFCVNLTDFQFLVPDLFI